MQYLVYQLYRKQYKRPVCLVEAGSPEEARWIAKTYYPSVEKVVSANQAHPRHVNFVFEFAVNRKLRHPKIVAMI